MRYMLIVLAAGLLGAIFNIIPLFYFIDQNYRIFFDLAFAHSPEIIAQLNREQMWIKLFGIGSFFVLTIFFGFVAFRMTSRIVGPLKVMQNHLKQITRGNWRLHAIKVRENDEFQDLIESYNYFYSSYRTMLQRDLERLKILNVDSSNRDAFLAWKEMIAERVNQLTLPKDLSNKQANSNSISSESEKNGNLNKSSLTLISAKNAEARGSRHAS